jgi:hypothetical protein
LIDSFYSAAIFFCKYHLARRSVMINFAKPLGVWLRLRRAKSKALAFIQPHQCFSTHYLLGYYFCKSTRLYSLYFCCSDYIAYNQVPDFKDYTKSAVEYFYNATAL